MSIEFPKPIKDGKGTTLCNRTACQTDKDVTWYHKTLDANYCSKCAELINNGCIGSEFHPLLIEIKDKSL